MEGVKMTKQELYLMLTGILVIGVFLGVAITCAIYLNSARGERNDPWSYCWVMCQPDSEVVIRERPDKQSDIVGAADCGRRLETDLKQKDGWLHLINVPNETGEGWIHSGYISNTEVRKEDHQYTIRSNGRVACRRYIGGPVREWIYDEAIVRVYLAGEEWCVTNRGFIKTALINFSDRLDIEPMNPDEMTWEKD
jgi:hypothetical protein